MGPYLIGGHGYRRDRGHFEFKIVKAMFPHSRAYAGRKASERTDPVHVFAVHPRILRLPLAFFAPAAALLFEVLWFRALGRVLAHGVAARSAHRVHAGHRAGGMLAARWAERIRRPALAFSAAESRSP